MPKISLKFSIWTQPMRFYRVDFSFGQWRPAIALKEMESGESVIEFLNARQHVYIFSFYVVQHFKTAQMIAANAVKIFGRSQTIRFCHTPSLGDWTLTFDKVRRTDRKVLHSKYWHDPHACCFISRCFFGRRRKRRISWWWVVRFFSVTTTLWYPQIGMKLLTRIIL